MEKNQAQILSEIKDRLAALRTQVAELEGAVEALEAAQAAEAAAAEQAAQQAAEQAARMAAEQAATPIDIDLADLDVTVPQTGTPAEAEPLAAPEPEPVLEPTPAPVTETTQKAPRPSINDAARAVQSVADRLGAPHAWRTDLPGSPVKNILSGISLNDRVLFINTLFREDPLLFQDTVAQFNAMETLDQAEEYIAEHFESWNLDSDIAYRFMMAVRRKLS